MNFIGCDPGKSGAFVVLNRNGDPNGLIKLSETEADVAEWLSQWSFTESLTGAFCMLENVHSFPGQGVASSFKFGQSLGFIRGLLIAYEIPFELVTPMKWQRSLGCLTNGDKNVSKAKAQELFPSIKITHAIADALLLAEYCKRTRGLLG